MPPAIQTSAVVNERAISTLDPGEADRRDRMVALPLLEDSVAVPLVVPATLSKLPAGLNN